MPLRLTMPTVAVLDVLIEATATDTQVWGLRICEQAHLGSGTVYPILDRLVEYGWVESAWECDQPSGRPKRRFYRMTEAGQREYAAALAARDSRRRAPSWRPSSAGGTA